MIHDLALSGYSLGYRSIPKPLFEFRPRMTVKRIQEAVADYYTLNLIHMTGDSKEWRHSHPRQLAMYLAREMLGRSTPDIGRLFGNRDHTTVIHAISAVKKRMVRNVDLCDDVEAIKAKLAA